MKGIETKKDLIIFVSAVIVVGAALGAISASVPDALELSGWSRQIFHYVLFSLGIGLILAVREWLRRRSK